jgi:Kef-type K+ transport system membrane component KefB
MTSAQLSSVFFLQVFFILAVCRCVGILARRVGQPQVVGEMIAGVIMGPSLFGLICPSWQQMIFPKDSLKILYVLA